MVYRKKKIFIYAFIPIRNLNSQQNLINQILKRIFVNLHILRLIATRHCINFYYVGIVSKFGFLYLHGQFLKLLLVHFRVIF